MADKDYSDVTWREFYDARRNNPDFGAAATRRVKSLGRSGDSFRYQLGDDDEFTIPAALFGNNPDAARSEVASYALYRRRVVEDGGTPSEFERPTKDGWA